MAASIDEFLKALASDHESLSRLRKLLQIEDDYAKKSDLDPIIINLDRQYEELKELRISSETQFTKVWEEIKAIREEMKAQREEMKAQREEMKAQREEMKAQREEMKAQSEELKELRISSETQFTKVWEEMRAQREEMSKGFKEMWSEVRRQSRSLHRRLDKHENWLKKMGGTDLELESLSWFRAVLRAKQLPHEDLIWKKKFRDPKERIGTSDIEFDIFSEDPLMAVEVSSHFSEISKVTNFIKKLEFLEEKFSRKALGVIVTFRFDPSIEDAAIELIESKNIGLISIPLATDWLED